jgi:mannose-6-phosphate isomerase-like protein (cupin superfamily)
MNLSKHLAIKFLAVIIISLSLYHDNNAMEEKESMPPHQMSITPLISPQNGLGYKIELFDLAEPVSFHYHKIQVQYLVVLEGVLGLSFKEQRIDLKSGDFVAIPPNTLHSIHPHGFVRFAAIDVPGFTYPEDVYDEGAPAQQATLKPFVCCQNECVLNTQIKLTHIPDLGEMPEAYHQAKITQSDYTVYPLATDPKEDHKWDLAILDIVDSPKHFHQRGIEHFLVLSGELAIELNEVRHILHPGHSVHIPPGVRHHLQSTTKEPVRVLCINFPAFDSGDFHGIDQ